MDKRRKGNYCKGKTKDGKPCGAAATPAGLCFFHANPNKASELGRKGGRSKRHVARDCDGPLPALESVKAVRDFVARLADEVYTGKTHPSVARGLASLLQIQLRVLHATDLEERLVKLERELARSEDPFLAPEGRDPLNAGTDGGSLWCSSEPTRSDKPTSFNHG